MTNITLITMGNTENFPTNSIQKILKQAFYDFELILIKDPSHSESELTLDNPRIKIRNIEEKGLNQTLNNSIKEAQGKYIIFSNTLNISNDILKKGYDKLEENNADLIYFTEKNKNTTIISRITQEKPFNYKKIKEFLFTTKYQLNNFLYNKEFLINNNIQFTNEIDDSDVFILKSILKAEKMLIYPHRLNSHKIQDITISEFKQYLKNLEDIKELAYLEEDEQLKKDVDNYNISQSIKQYDELCFKYKKEAYVLLRNYFIEILNSKTIEQYINNLTNDNRKLFEQVIITESVEEYELLKKVYEDKKHISYMTRYRKILQTEYKKISEFNHSLVSSNSWKLTKFLRIRKK